MNKFNLYCSNLHVFEGRSDQRYSPSKVCTHLFNVTNIQSKEESLYYVSVEMKKVNYMKALQPLCLDCVREIPQIL